MSEQYMELYKKYRPRVWGDVIGQDTIVESFLSNLKNNTLATAYLLNGDAGTGKTTVAKLLSKSLNCENLKENFDPCNECPICTAIDSDSLLGVKYISMSTAGGVNEVKELMEMSRMSQPIKKKVYILDEVQNLSIAAQDAMLQDLESETQQTLFLLCTTNPEKIRPAILSRCQIRTFQKVGLKDLGRNLVRIAKAENLTNVDKQMIKTAAINANGSVRTSITNLEYILSNGSFKENYSEQIINAIIDGNPATLFQIIEEMDSKTSSTLQTTDTMYKDLVNTLIYISTKNQDLIRYDELSKKLSVQQIMFFLDELGKAINQMSNRTIEYKTTLEIYTSRILMKFKQLKKA